MSRLPSSIHELLLPGMEHIYGKLQTNFLKTQKAQLLKS
jgi:hypothetical protein